MQRSDLLAIMATLLIREQCVSAQASQFEGAVDDAEAILKVIELRRGKNRFATLLARVILVVGSGLVVAGIARIGSLILK
jgi:hypothetical protein